MTAKIGAAVLLGVMALWTVGATAAVPPQSNWRRLDSPSFVVIGEVGVSDLRDIAVKFEAFREVLGRLLSERVTIAPVPTVVIVFRSDTTFRPFMPLYQGKRVDVGGLFVPSRDINYIAMVADGNAERLRVIFHEYAHLLVSNTGQRVPVWLNEGIAEYYSTFELQKGGREAIIGRVIENHIQYLNTATLLKLPELLAVDHKSPLYNEGSRRSVFYAQAWALTHLILRSERAAGLTAYLQQLSRGAAPLDAWQQAFGSQDLERELGMYIRRQAFTATLYRFTDRLATFRAESASVAPADVQAYLADLLIQEDRLDEAAARLETAVKLDASNARASVARALLELERGNGDAAGRDLRGLPELGDWLLNYQAGVGLSASLERRGEPATPADVSAVRAFLSKGRPGDHEFANALARQAALELRGRQTPTEETRAALQRAWTSSPGRYEYGFLLAQVLARQSNFAAARSVLGPMMSALYPDNVRDAARDLMAWVVNVENSRVGDRLGSSPAPSPSTGRAPTTGPSKPLLRDLREGEQRFEGQLENIECVVGKGVTFRVKTASETVAVTAADLTSVNFITYRNDLTGSIQCGPISPSLPVYVTWRAGATAGSKIAVTLEFPPK